MGRKLISRQALVERIAAAFWDAYDHTDALHEADTYAKRMSLVREIAEYTLTVESLHLNLDEKATLYTAVYSELFGFGALDPLFADERITTIELHGANQANIRYGHGELEPLPALFQNESDFQHTLKRLLLAGDVDLRPDVPFMEFGLLAGERPVCVNLTTHAIPPTLDIRVHPRQPLSEADLIASGFMTAESAAFLESLVESPHGLLILGESESGKTTLMSLIASWLPHPETALVVERAGEMRLPHPMRRLAVKWPRAEQPATTFSEQITAALAQTPQTILLDELRADDAASIAPLLREANAPRQIWSLRGSIFAKRLHSALAMIAHRADTKNGDALARALFERLPFVLMTNHVNGALKLWGIGEWQWRPDSSLPTFIPLWQMCEGVLQKVE